MKILNYNKHHLQYTNGCETFDFLNLASVDYYDVGSRDNYWVLINYKRKVEDGLELDVKANVHQNGAYSEIVLGYHIHNLIRRRIVLDFDENVEKDYIMFFNPLSIYDAVSYRAHVQPGCHIMNYLGDNDRNYYDGDTMFRNNVLTDELVEHFISTGSYFGYLLNTYGNDPKKMKEMIHYFDHPVTVSEYHSEANKVFQKES